MLQSTTIQTKLGITDSDGYFIRWYGIIPDSQEESRFLDHVQWVHLSTICDSIVNESVRKFWTPCTKGSLFYLDDGFRYGYNSIHCYEHIGVTEWAREALLNRSCTKSCSDCPELVKRKRKIECRIT